MNWQNCLLSHLSSPAGRGSETRAAKRSGVALKTVWNFRHAYPEFAQALASAKAEAARELAISQYYHTPTFANAVAVLVTMSPEWAWAQKRKKRAPRFSVTRSSKSLRQLGLRAGVIERAPVDC
jgi:hypothetical protein